MSHNAERYVTEQWIADIAEGVATCDSEAEDTLSDLLLSDPPQIEGA